MKAILVVCSIICVHFVHCTPVPYKYGVIMNAGSSGTRIYVYRWQKPFCDQLPKMHELLSFKQKPGLSEYEDRQDELPQYLGTLINKAKEVVPADLHGSTPIYLFATAGLRKFAEVTAKHFLDAVKEVLDDDSVNPFSFTERNREVKVLSGEEEGTYGWVAVNYLLGKFNKDTDPGDTVGIVEMGGASTQIAFVPDVPMYEGKFRIELAGRVYELYSQSYMSYGQNMLEDRIEKEAWYLSRKKREFYNPCVLGGDDRSVTIDGRHVKMYGGADPNRCAAIEKYFLKKARGDMCSPKPCAIGGVYQPPVTTNDFYALSAYYYAPSTLFAIESDGRLNIPLLGKNAEKLCRMSYEDAREWTNVDDMKYLSSYCTMGLYIPMLLTESYGFPKNAHNIKVAKEIEGSNIDWTLGAMLDENSLSGDCQDRGLRKRSLRVKRK